MKRIYNPSFLGWAAFTFLLYGYSIFTENKEVLDYGHFLFFIVPLIIFFGYPFSFKIHKNNIFPFIMGLAGSAALFLPSSIGFLVSLVCVSFALLPILYRLDFGGFFGISFGVILLFLLQTADLINTAYIVIFIFLEIFYLISLYFKKVLPMELKSNLFLKGKINILLIFILITNVSSIILTWSILPGFIVKNQLPGICISFFISTLLFVKFFNTFKKNSVISNIRILFLACFLLVFFQGFLSKAYGLAFNVYFVVIMILFVISNMSVLSLLNTRYKVSEKDIFTSSLFHFLMYSSVLLILSIHVPLCYLWIEKINTLSLPKETFPLSFGQYFLKNITLLSVISTLLAGYIFLIRRSW
ncbi:MAG: hypothetical protein IPF52_01910 [Saprospiraceae bacterium]|nr:hypothetical protein [Saprospiraceae bacterium]